MGGRNLGCNLEKDGNGKERVETVKKMPTWAALEDFALFSSILVMEMGQIRLYYQLDAHVEENFVPLTLIIINPLHSKALLKRFTVSIHACLLLLGCKL